MEHALLAQEDVLNAATLTSEPASAVFQDTSTIKLNKLVSNVTKQTVSAAQISLVLPAEMVISLVHL